MLADVRAATQRNRLGGGWKNVYVRREHPTSIASLLLTQQTVMSAFGKDIQARRLVLSSGGADVREVSGGFAFQVPGLGTLYGNAQEERVLSLGVVPARGAIQKPAREALNAFCLAHRMELVDWERQDFVDPEVAIWGAP